MTGSHGERDCDAPVVRSTDGVPRRARAAYWRDAVREPFPELSVDWLSDRPIRARLESRPFADASIAMIENTPAKVTWTPRAQASDACQLVLHLAGDGWYAHNGHDVVQRAGDLVLIDKTRPFVSVFGVDFRVLVWELPREMLLPLLAAPERAVGLRIAGSHGPGAVLGSYARALAVEAGRLDAAARRSLVLHLCSLTSLTLGAGVTAGRSSNMDYRAARRQQIFAYIEAHFRDGSVSAERAARDLRMSRRWLHALFEGTGTTFAAWVARRRVEDCRKLLDDPTQDHLSIAEIAFRCGFNELSTFNRQYRARYDAAPRDARRNRVPRDPGP